MHAEFDPRRKRDHSLDDSAIVVIGASYGGVDALLRISAELTSELNAAVFITLHIGAHRSHLPSLWNSYGELPAAHAEDGEPIVPGRVYIAPPDHHLLVQRQHIRLSRGPRENWARPAIDPMFRTAAKSYGARVIGVILTGRLNDGTAGLYEVKMRGGATLIQDPADAACPEMPASALVHVGPDHCVPLFHIPELLVHLTLVHASGKDRVT
jgi:two-component system chemotaxis response regulator CheB